MGYEIMIGEHFYHKSIKKVIATFGSLFSDITIQAGTDEIITVPIHYAHKQKFIEVATNNTDVRNMYTDVALPIIGFEITSFTYSPERMTNPMNIQNIRPNGSDEVKFMFTSIPYSISLEMYIATNTVDEGYQIIEQIVPFFTPQLTVTISDIDFHNIKTNLTFDLSSFSQDIQNESVFDEKRVCLFNFSFLCHTKFHSNPRSMERIKKVIIDMKEADHEKAFDRFVGDRNLMSDEFDWTGEHHE